MLKQLSLLSGLWIIFSYFYIFLIEIIFIKMNNPLSLNGGLHYNQYSCLNIDSHSHINKICVEVSLRRQK